MTYQSRSFNLPELKGLSAEQIKVHLGLYEGYVKHVNLIMDKIAALRAADPEGNAYPINEMRRRLGFEFDGMRLHEYYFEQFEGGHCEPDEGSALFKATIEKYGDKGGLVAHMKEVAGTRGIGWVVVYADPKATDPQGRIHTAFVNDHELGQLAGLPIVAALDLWEHAFMVDYKPAEKNQYVAAFFDNLNWKTVEARFPAAA
jgi:Fe-Mn family superoxide dismutase